MQVAGRVVPNILEFFGSLTKLPHYCSNVKQSANNESIVLRRKTVELEDSFFLNLMDGKQSREKAN